MKKFGLAATLAMCMTVGGVYATWTFAEGNTVEANTTVTVGMTGMNAATEKGVLSVMVMGESGYSFAIDDANNDHKPDEKKSGTVTITFTPNAHASEDIKTDGIDVKFSIKYVAKTGGAATLADWKYDGATIFDVTYTDSNPLHLDAEAATYANGVFTWTIDAASVGLALTSDIKEVVVDTVGKYNAMKAELEKGEFQLVVSECTESQINPAH